MRGEADQSSRVAEGRDRTEISWTGEVHTFCFTYSTGETQTVE